jgi:hypothetical protein
VPIKTDISKKYLLNDPSKIGNILKLIESMNKNVFVENERYKFASYNLLEDYNIISLTNGLKIPVCVCENDIQKHFTKIRDKYSLNYDIISTETKGKIPKEKDFKKYYNLFVEIRNVELLQFKILKSIMQKYRKQFVPILKLKNGEQKLQKIISLIHKDTGKQNIVYSKFIMAHSDKLEQLSDSFVKNGANFTENESVYFSLSEIVENIFSN